MDLKTLVAVALLTAGVAGVAAAQTAPAPVASPALRSQKGSNYNIEKVERHLAHIITQLQHDQRDYGGHRVSAVKYLQQADSELQAAIAYQQQHPGQ